MPLVTHKTQTVFGIACVGIFYLSAALVSGPEKKKIPSLYNTGVCYLTNASRVCSLSLKLLQKRIGAGGNIAIIPIIPITGAVIIHAAGIIIIITSGRPGIAKAHLPIFPLIKSLSA